MKDLHLIPVLIISICAGIVIGCTLQMVALRREAIHLHHARYNPGTGNFEWITNSLPESK